MAFNGTGKVWMNGKIVDWEDATIHIASHVVHYGSAVFEGARCYKTPKDRRSSGSTPTCGGCTTRRGSTAWTTRSISDALTQGVIDTVKANGLEACYIRPLLYRGYNALGVNPLPCPVDAAILVWEWGAYLGAEALETRRRRPRQLVDAQRAEHVPRDGEDRRQLRQLGLIKMEAVLGGYSEGIALDPVGLLSEGSGQNLFLVRDDIVYTPPMSASVLPGITRDTSSRSPRISASGPRTGHASRDAVHRRRGLLRRHGRRSHAHPVGRQDPGRRRPRGPITSGLADRRSSTTSTASCRTGTAG